MFNGLYAFFVGWFQRDFGHSVKTAGPALTTWVKQTSLGWFKLFLTKPY